MKKINKLHPWLPQVYRKKSPAHPDLNREIRMASLRATRAEKEYLRARKRCEVLGGVHQGPSTPARIAAIARYHQAWRERTKANYELRELRAIKRSR